MAAVAHERLGHHRAMPRGLRRLRPEEDAAAARAVSVARVPSTQPHCRPPVLAAVLVVALLVVGGSIVDAVASAVGRPDRTEAAPAVELSAVEAGQHLVQPGETYWSIAEAMGGAVDIRARVDALQAANGGGLLRAGDRLTLPARE